jgi:histidyl-tRNA synthetase
LYGTQRLRIERVRLITWAGEGKDMVIRDKIFSTITNVFKRHGAVTIDTLVSL